MSTCSGIPPATRWLGKAWIQDGYSITWAMPASPIRCVTPQCRRSRSKTFGGDVPSYASCPLITAAAIAAGWKSHRRRVGAQLLPRCFQVVRIDTLGNNRPRIDGVDILLHFPIVAFHKLNQGLPVPLIDRVKPQDQFSKHLINDSCRGVALIE